jgi:hypothetical protein
MPPKILFINVTGDKSAVSQRDQELQAAEARAHAARVSRRPTQRSGTVKHESSGSSRARLSGVPGSSGVSSLRPGRGKLRRRAKVIQEVEEEEDQGTPLDKRRLHALSTSSLGQGQVDPFDSAPVKGLDNSIYSILDFGMCPASHDDRAASELITSPCSVRLRFPLFRPSCPYHFFAHSSRKPAQARAPIWLSPRSPNRGCRQIPNESNDRFERGQSETDAGHQ